MEAADGNIHIPEKRLAAVCGLFCPACGVFIGTREYPERLDVSSFLLILKMLHYLTHLVCERDA